MSLHYLVKYLCSKNRHAQEVIEANFVYSNMIFVDNKLTLTCLLTQQQLVTVSVRHTQVISLML